MTGGGAQGGPPTSTLSRDAERQSWLLALGLTGCSGKPGAPPAAPQGSGWLRRPDHSEPLTSFEGTAREATGNKMGGMWGSLKQTLDPLVLTKMRIWRCDLALGDRQRKCQKNTRKGQRGAGAETARLGDRTFHPKCSVLLQCFQAKYTFLLF